MEESDFLVQIINTYIKFYKTEINDVNIFDGITDIGSTNQQLELLYSEMHKYKESNDEFKEIHLYTNKLYSYIIMSNNNPYCSSNSLFALLIEFINLQNENNIKNLTIKINKE